MLEVGITGGIGSGKTTVCHIFEVLGIPVFYADAEAKKVMASDRELIRNIKSLFGEDIYAADGALDRARLSTLVFNDRAKLEALNALVHPATINAYKKWVQEQHAPYVLKEAALLFETGSYKLSSINVLVTAPEQTRIARVIARDQVHEKEVRARMDKQWKDEQKIGLADFEITNDGLKPVLPQVLDLHGHFLSISTPLPAK